MVGVVKQAFHAGVMMYVLMRVHWAAVPKTMRARRANAGLGAVGAGRSVMGNA
eukprot:COSAG01_NODE_37747_length_499_cov_1.032500_1_plen_52_part_01